MKPSQNNTNQQVYIFDTTLRDGQQCPGAGMNFEKNLEYARLAANVNIDILEAGFPAASAEDYKIVESIARMYSQMQTSPKVAALCQMREEQIATTIKSIESLIPNGRARLHVYLPVDPELMHASLGDYANNTAKIHYDLNRFITMAVGAGCEVEFSPEGYSRMGDTFDFVTDVIDTAIQAGATVINCPDTIGGACYLQGEDFFVNKMIKHADIMHKRYPNKDIIWSAHCHNDYGLALTNTMQSIFDGPVTQIEGCFNGIGERAGNVSIEQCIMYLKAFGQNNCTGQNYYTNTNTQNIKDISDFVATHMLPRQAHWPISGENAARHSSGGHTNAILKNPQAYQPFNPQDVGQEISFVFGPLSGSNHAQSIINEHGYVCTNSEKTQVTQFIKDYFSNRRKGLTDTEFMQAYFAYRETIKVNSYTYAKRAQVTEICIAGIFNGEEKTINATSKIGGTALTTLHKALEEYLSPISIESYRSQSKDKGKNAMSIASISISHHNELFTGIGEDNDIEVSALKALVNAVNRTLTHQKFALVANRKAV
ncbi:MAG: LeuA family protein [Marinicellaceae bacterium]